MKREGKVERTVVFFLGFVWVGETGEEEEGGKEGRGEERRKRMGGGAQAEAKRGEKKNLFKQNPKKARGKKNGSD